MKNRMKTGLMVLAAAAFFQAAAAAAGVKDLYLSTPGADKAVHELSSVKPGKETSSIIAAIRKELECVNKIPKPADCHSPRFVQNAITVAGTLALKDSGSPWDFLIWMSEGDTLNEGSFFQAPEDNDEHRGTMYFTPSKPDPKLTAAALQKQLDAEISKAGIIPSCSWTRDRVKAFAGIKLEQPGLILFSYGRDYSPPGISGEYRVSYSKDWLFKGDKLAACAGRLAVIDLKGAGLFAAEILDRSGEQTVLDIIVHDLRSGNRACAYSVEGVSETEQDPLMEAAAPEKYLPQLFDFSAAGCKPKKISGYSYTRI